LSILAAKNFIFGRFVDFFQKNKGMNGESPAGVQSWDILRVERDRVSLSQLDMLAVEEPLEIQIAFGAMHTRHRQSLAVTMRTPGQDFDLAMGFLFTEGIISRAADVLLMRFAGEQLPETAQENVLLVELRPGLDIDMQRLSRHFYTASSCGICGKASIEMVQTHTCFSLLSNEPSLTREVLFALPEALAASQEAFAHTGGIHAAGLFDAAGKLLLLREDVGRHNAVDKLVGAALSRGLVPLSRHILLVSGRAGFELVQKSLMAGVPVLASVGAPSSLSVELAETYGMTLIGFLRQGRFNVYAGKQRCGESVPA
jgi:FdhD protein